VAAQPAKADYGLDAPGVVVGSAVGGAAAGVGWAALRRRHRVPAAVLGGWLAAWGLVGVAQAGLMVRSSRPGGQQAKRCLQGLVRGGVRRATSGSLLRIAGWEPQARQGRSLTSR
jgi:hypothetical protein